MVLRNGGESRLWATRENEGIREASPSYSVRPNGTIHQWRKKPPGELSVDPGS